MIQPLVCPKGTAVRLFQLALKQGHAFAQWRLGKCYKDGTGVAKDAGEAKRLWQLAADQGHEAAKRNLVFLS